jgi:hypothetical protein
MPPAAEASHRRPAHGIVQASDPILTWSARPFALPAAAEDAGRVVAELPSTAERVVEVDTFR